MSVSDETLQAIRGKLIEECAHTSVMPTFDEEEAKKVLGGERG